MTHSFFGHWKNLLKHHRTQLFIVFAFVILAAAGCGQQGQPPAEETNGQTAATEDEETAGDESEEQEENKGSQEKLTVAVSIVPQKSFVEKIAGDLAEVVLMVPPGNSPGNYEPTPGEIEKFSRAALYFAIGVPTEEPNILPRAEEIDSLETISLHDEVAAAYPDRKLDAGRRDPHIWLSPQRVITMVEAMAREMGEADPDNAQVYAQNAQAYIEEIEELKGDLEETFSQLENRKFIVFHPAFGYLADDYDLEMYALEYEGKEATPQRMQEIIDLALEEDIRVIFYQQEIDSQQSRAFAEEINGEMVQLAPLAPNYIENLRKMAATMAEVL